MWRGLGMNQGFCQPQGKSGKINWNSKYRNDPLGLEGLVLFLIQYVSQTLTAMKILNSFKDCALMITATSLFCWCGGEGNTGNKLTEIDSVRDSNHILHHERIPEPDEARRFVANNAFQATFASATDFNSED